MSGQRPICPRPTALLSSSCATVLVARARLAGCPVKRSGRPQTSCSTVVLSGSCPGCRVKADVFPLRQVPEALL